MSDPTLTNFLADLAALKVKYAARGIQAFVISAEYIIIHIPPKAVPVNFSTGVASTRE